MDATHPNPEPLPPRKGTKTKLLGVVLLILAMLDALLSWRGGFALDSIIVLLFAGGIVLLVVGALRQGD
jgi:multisubunit Na+/H+ antiporter MnhG subunit|tara:strand:+ start:105 stop:311 length:207 start_codon:yes stop_codon:yes gene_type:complete